jgi:hypothetical protein
VGLEESEIGTYTIHLDTFIAKGAVSGEDRLRELRKRIRTDHLNDQERRAIMHICEYYIDILKLPGDKLTTVTTTEHAIPTPGVDPRRGTVSSNYQITESFDLLKTKRNLLYIRNQSVPRCKHFLPRLQKPINYVLSKDRCLF